MTSQTATREHAFVRWHELLEGRRRQMEDAYARLGRDNADFWARRVAQFRRAYGLAQESDPLLRRVLALLPPGGSVLDVGAGYGRLALPLARHAGEVVAVEPQAVMSAYLTEDAARAGITNIRLIAEGWLEAEARVAPADVVLCAGVLFAQPGLADIAAWLRTLDAHARRAVVVSLPASWGDPPLLAQLWQRFHGEPRIPTSTYIEVYDILHALGIPANVEVYDPRVPTSWRFGSLDEAVAAVRETVIMPAAEEVDGVLRAALEQELRRVDGAWELPMQPASAATIWWERGGPRLPGAPDVRPAS